MSATKTRKRRITARPRVKLWLELNDASMFCGGLAKMLEAVDETGSIKHAAQHSLRRGSRE